MLEDVGKPKVGDKIRVALKELEITGVIAEEDNMIDPDGGCARS